jgi:RNA polymerase sigma-70 factor, ECF subfamily
MRTRERPVHPTDAELVEQTRRGDQRAFHVLVDRHGPVLYRAAVALVGSAADAEDVVQETWVGAYRGLARFAGRSLFRTWLSGILVRQAARLLARRGQERAGLHQLVGQSERTPADGPGAASVGLDVTRALGCLSLDHRLVMVLRELQGLSYAEMAEILDVPQGTIESRIHRARLELRSILKDYVE